MRVKKDKQSRSNQTLKFQNIYFVKAFFEFQYTLSLVLGARVNAALGARVLCQPLLTSVIPAECVFSLTHKRFVFLIYSDRKSIHTNPWDS